MSELHEGILKFSELMNSESAPEGMGSLSVKFVSYPSSQQLIVWLPQSAYMGYTNYELSYGEKIMEQDTVMGKINGSTQMLWDTLNWPPGNYKLKINHGEGWFHLLILIKEENPGPTEAGTPYETAVIDAATIQNYLTLIQNISEKPNGEKEASSPGPNERNSNISTQDFTPDELNIRMKAQRMIEESFAKLFQSKQDLPKLEYEEQGRSGTIYFIDENIRIPFYYEMGAYPAHLVIDIPRKEKWEQQTGIALDKRRETLLHIASTVRREKAPSWRFEINDDSIVYYDA